MIRQLVFCVGVADQSEVSEARRLARSAALDSGLSEEDAARAALVATEAATNLVKHARGGEILIRPGTSREGSFMDVLAVDRGPGMTNLAECLRDGYTTKGTAGNGLGAIVRQAVMFDAYSKPGSGTVLLARIGPGVPRPSHGDAARIHVDGLSLKMKGQEVCGDNWTWAATSTATALMIADGLGHGGTAAEAADEAVAAFHQSPVTAPVEVLDRVHRALLKTRGAAVSVAHIDPSKGRVTYAGIGNVAATIEDGSAARHLVSLHGIAGHQVRRLQDFQYPWNPGDVLVMHSDGVNAHWSLGNYPGLSERHPLVIAAVLLRDFSRGRDDATVVVAGQRGAGIGTNSMGPAPEQAADQ